jgi:WD40 repeat protein
VLPAAAAAAFVIAAGALTTYLVLRPGGTGPAVPDAGGPKREDQPKPFAPRRPLTAEELARLPSPLDGRKRKDIPPALLALARGGDPTRAPPELVAVLGDGRFQLPHTGMPGWMGQDPAGKLLAVPCGSDVVLFDARTGACLRGLRGHAGRVLQAAFSPDGKRLAAVSDEAAAPVKFWDPNTGQETLALTLPPEHGRRTLAWGPDGRRFATGGTDGTVRVWDASSGEKLFVLRGHTKYLHGVAFSPDGRRIASSSVDGTVRVWDAEKGEQIRTLKGHTSWVGGVLFSPDGKWLASGSNELILWDARTLERVRTIPRQSAWLAWSPDGRTLLAGGMDDRTITRWDAATGKELSRFSLKLQGGSAFYHLSPDGKTLYARCVASPGPFVHAYDAVTGRELFAARGPAGPVFAVAVSPDGRTLASGGADNAVRLWDLATCTPVAALERHTDRVLSLAFSPDGKLLASGSSDGTIVMWDPVNRREVRTLTGYFGAPSPVAFSPDGRAVAAGGQDGSVKFWDVPTGGPKEPLRWHTGPVRSVAFSPDGRLLASGGLDKTVQLCEVATGRRVHTFRAGATVVNVAFGPDGRTLAAETCPEHVLRVWDVATKGEVAASGHGVHLNGLAMHPGGRLLATAARDGTVRFEDLASRLTRVLAVGPGPFGGAVHQVAFTPEGRYLATANDNGAVSILRVPGPPVAYAPGSPLKPPDPAKLAGRPSAADALKREDIPEELLKRAGGGDAAKAPPELVAILGGARGHAGQVFAVVISPDGRTLASAGIDRTIKLWDLATARLVRTLTGHANRVHSLAFHPKGKALVSCSLDGTIKLWDLTSGKERYTRTGNVTFHVAIGPGGRRFASCGEDRLIKIWDTASGKLLRTLAGHASEVWRVVFSADGTVLASAGGDRTVRLWDVAGGWQFAVLRGQTDHVRSVLFSPDGRTLASASNDRAIRLWDLATLQEKQTLRGHTGSVLSIAWHAGGRLLASVGGDDGTLRLWDVTTDPPRTRQIRLFPSGVQWLDDLAFTPEGRYLATANPDGTVYILRLARRGEVFQVPAGPTK